MIYFAYTRSTKQIFDVEEKPFISSLNISPEGCCRKGRVPPPPPTTYFPALSVDISFKDDVTVIIYRRPTLYPLEIAVDFLKSL
jgi:hypothetical protein